MNRSKVESVDVDQSILGRVFSFGTIVRPRAPAAALEPIRLISDPLTFRSHITGELTRCRCPRAIAAPGKTRFGRNRDGQGHGRLAVDRAVSG